MLHKATIIQGDKPDTKELDGELEGLLVYNTNHAESDQGTEVKHGEGMEVDPGFSE